MWAVSGHGAEVSPSKEVGVNESIRAAAALRVRGQRGQVREVGGPQSGILYGMTPLHTAPSLHVTRRGREGRGTASLPTGDRSAPGVVLGRSRRRSGDGVMVAVAVRSPVGPVGAGGGGGRG